MPYAEMGRVCVCCVVLCVAVCVLAGRGIHPYACGGRKVLKGPRKVDSLHTTRFFVFWTLCRRNASNVLENLNVNPFPPLGLVVLNTTRISATSLTPPTRPGDRSRGPTGRVRIHTN